MSISGEVCRVGAPCSGDSEGCQGKATLTLATPEMHIDLCDVCAVKAIKALSAITMLARPHLKREIDAFFGRSSRKAKR